MSQSFIFVDEFYRAAYDHRQVSVAKTTQTIASFLKRPNSHLHIRKHFAGVPLVRTKFGAQNLCFIFFNQEIITEL